MRILGLEVRAAREEPKKQKTALDPALKESLCTVVDTALAATGQVFDISGHFAPLLDAYANFMYDGDERTRSLIPHVASLLTGAVVSDIYQGKSPYASVTHLDLCVTLPRAAGQDRPVPQVAGMGHAAKCSALVHYLTNQNAMVDTDFGLRRVRKDLETARESLASISSGRMRNSTVLNYDYLSPTVAGDPVPFGDPRSEHAYFSNLAAAFTEALNTGKISVETGAAISGYRLPVYVTALIEKPADTQ